MKALLLHDIAPDGLAAAALEASGIDVARCAPNAGRPYPCVGADGPCPLDGTVDVAVVVHDGPSTDFHPGEVGVVCAQRDGIPLVVAGNGAFAPFRGQATVVAAGVSDLASACERAVQVRSERIGRTVGADVSIDGDRVRATLPPGSTGRDAVDVHRALAATLPSARTIDVTIGAAPEQEGAAS